MKNVGRQWNLNYIAVTKTLEWQTNKGNKEIDLREKNLFSWQNVWNSRQIATDIKEKLGNQEEVPCGGIRLIYLPILIKRMETMPRSYQQ